MNIMKHVIISTMLMFFPALVFAHGAGDAIQKEHNGYLLSVGSADVFMYANEAGRINFEIETKAGVAFEGWSGVWTRVERPNGELLFAGTIERGGDGLLAGMSYYFPEPGVYDITLRFMDRGRVIAESSFPLPVLENPATPMATRFPSDPFTYLVVLVLGVVGGFAINDIFLKKRLS
jgi:hypothetical protein